MRKELYNAFYPEKNESVNYYRNGEDKRLTYKKYGKYNFKYHYRTTYAEGIGNNLSGLIHMLINHGKNIPENVKVYKNGILIKEWQR